MAPTNTQHRKPRTLQRSLERSVGRVGMTLIEIMVAIAIMLILAGGATFGAATLPRARLRASAGRFASACRFAYVHALTTGRTTRVSFPIGNNTIQIEDTDDRHTLDAHDPLHGGGSADIEIDAREAARLMADPRPRATRASFTPIANFRGRPLESGVVFIKVFSQHDLEPKEQGMGYVYFFSGGRAERAVVQMRNSRDEVYSIVVNPLTGRAEIRDQEFTPETVNDQETSDSDEIDARDRSGHREVPR